MVETEKDVDVSNLLGKPYKTVLFNDDHHDMQEVIIQIMKAIKCDAGRASQIMLTAHTNGSAIVYTGSREKCELVSAILEEIRLGTKVEPA